MSRRAVPFRIADVTRACKGVIAAGLMPRRAEIGQDGKIVMVFDGDVEPPPQASALDRWLEGKNAKAD